MYSKDKNLIASKAEMLYHREISGRDYQRSTTKHNLRYAGGEKMLNREKGAAPLYSQIVEIIKGQIESGEFVKGDLFPTEKSCRKSMR